MHSDYPFCEMKKQWSQRVRKELASKSHKLSGVSKDHAKGLEYLGEENAKPGRSHVREHPGTIS